IQFEMSLIQYLSVTAPFAHAIKCLESAHTTIADVFIYWLAIMSRLQFLLIQNRSKLSSRMIGDICAIANQRFDRLINEVTTDVYVTASFLDHTSNAAL
ncbi:hypothetical protein C8Q80DRAFT_1109374, partial [Daedaleopsis nitida]